MMSIKLDGRQIDPQDLEAIEAAGFLVGYGASDSKGEPFAMLGKSPLRGTVMTGSDGREYDGIERSEPFQPREKVEHGQFIGFALYSLRRGAMVAGDAEGKERFERALGRWNEGGEVATRAPSRKSGLSM